MGEAVEVAVIRVEPVGRGRLLALASVELVIGGVRCRLHGLQVLRLRQPDPDGNAIEVEPPCYRAPDGTWRLAVELPEALHAPIADAVLGRCCELGLVRRP
jgi:stage V sporulation protein G